MASPEQREQFARYKADVDRRGKSFFPHAMFHDTVMSLVVVSVIVALAAIWYYDSSEEPGEAGILGPRYTEEADPGTTQFVPRPDWYFFFLFYLLRIFKWPESVILGTVGIPTILMILLFVVPFLDRRRERRLVRRPVAVVASLLLVASMGVLTYKGATAEEPGGESAAVLLEAAGLPEEEELVRGANLFGAAGCTSCHNYAGTGAVGPGPALTEVGARLQEDAIRATITNGRGGGMPAFGESLTEEQIADISAFLAASKGAGRAE